MSRRWKIAIGTVIGILILLSLNAIALNSQTKDAKATVDGAQIVDAFGGHMQVTDTGKPDGPPIVLIHCYTCSLRWWDGMLGDLEQGNRVIRVDLLGHGGSEKAKTGYSIEDQAGTVASALAELGVSQATVVGHSLGFAVATALAERSPELVARLVDIDQAATEDLYHEPFLAKLSYVPLIGQAIARVVPDFAIRDSYKELFAPGYNMASGFENPDQPVADFHAMTYTSFKKAAQAEDNYVEDRPLDERLAQLAIPLLVIFGTEDQIYDPAQEAADAYKDVPGVAITMVQGAGHSPNVEKPAQTAGLILEFAANPAAPGTAIPGQNEFKKPPNKQTAPKKGKKGAAAKP